MSYDQHAPDDARIDIAAILSAIVRRLPRIILVTLGLLALTFVFLMFQPRLYESSASILVEPRTATEQTNTVVTGNAIGVVSSQIGLIKSRDTLISVIDALDLRSVSEFNGSQSGFSPLGMIMQLAGRGAATPNSIDETVIRTLDDRLSVSQQGDSGIISVSVLSEDPDLAARIANAIANTHVSRRAGLSISDTAETSGWLRGEIERLRGSVVEAESAVAEFRVNNDLLPNQGNTSLLDQQLSTISANITAAQERRSTAEARAALIRGMIDRGQPLEGLADVQSSAIIQQLSQEKARVQGELAQRSATLLSSHPTMRSLNAQVNQLNEQIRIEGQRVAASLDAEAQIQSDLETSLRAELARSKSSASTATRDTVTLDSLEREAKAQRDLLEAYLLRYNEASSRVEANSALPDVRVVSVAAPSVTPASPKTSLVMIGVGLVSVALQIGIIAFSELMSGRALAPVRARPQDELEAVPFDEAELEPEQRWEEPEVVAETEPVIVPIVEPVVAEPVLAEPVLVEPEVVEPIAPAAEAMAPQPDTARQFIQMVMADNKADDVVEPDLPLPPMVTPRAMPQRRRVPGVVRYSDLSSDLVLGRTHLLLLADHTDDQPSQLMAEELVGAALGQGLSVALIDAGTGRRTEAPGLTDLSAGSASFGDVVQKSADNSFAEVTWGQGRAVDARSSKPLTLVEALGDIYEVVVVLTGKVGGTSTLPYFAELGGRIVLVTGAETSVEEAEAVRRSLQDAGLPQIEIAALAEAVAA
ncbi:GumC family protein [Devosia rhizoryzae]|uniref:GumC family protein n=1 Tax=Devosia rhizoryzae TaxID=2774137 RepID=A0ABX7C9D4_9HYPH|nr:GumC family protein [Devosia rhizoryzae]QQR40897.1 GumC family protein [Devosia rhizoryzae]